MTLLDILQVCACGVSLVAAWFAGKKSLWGPILSILDFLPWAGVAVLTHTYYVLAFDVVLTILSVRTLYFWSVGALLNTG